MSESTQNPQPDLEELKKACEAEMENVIPEKEKTQEPVPEPPAPAEEAKEAKETSAPEIEQLKKELAEAKDRTLRLMAEFDNYRRRTAKEHLELIETANAKLLGKLSEVLDNFERAFAPENSNSDAAAFEQGMKLIQEQFQKTLTEAGLIQLNPIGEIFDPNCHEALLTQPSETIAEQHIVQVFQKGYMIKNKLIKTAKVIVSSGPGNNDSK